MIEQDKIRKAILLIDPNASFTVTNADINNIEWNSTPISKEEIEAKLSEAEDLILADAYKAKRSKEYPTIRDQLDDIYHNGVAGWKTTIKAVKDKYPKG